MWILIAVGAGVLALAHTAPVPFLFDAIAGGRSVWHMPKRTPPTIYFTFDDGPNPTTTPDLLDVLSREGVRATFFLIDRHITERTAPLVRRMFADGHAVALHSATRRYMLMSPDAFARTLTGAADHIERAAGARPCRAFRPHAGWRSAPMYAGLSSRSTTSGKLPFWMRTSDASARATRPFPSWNGWICVNAWCSQAARTSGASTGNAW